MSAPTTLESTFAGELIAPDDPGYDQARGLFNGSIDKRPALIARCRGAEDVRIASRRSVLTRSPEPRGIDPGATTRTSTPRPAAADEIRPSRSNSPSARSFIAVFASSSCSTV